MKEEENKLTPNANLTISQLVQKSISFSDAEGMEEMRLEPGKFFWKGEEIKDIHQVYERFNDWLKGIKNEK